MSKTLEDWLASSSSSSEVGGQRSLRLDGFQQPFSPIVEGPTVLTADASLAQTAMSTAALHTNPSVHGTQAKMQPLLGAQTVASLSADSPGAPPPPGVPTQPPPHRSTIVASTRKTPTGSSSPNDDYEAVEVMVVDRGTQTVSTVGVQTDPLPSDQNWGNPVFLPGRVGSPMYHNSIDYLSNAGGPYGIDGRPYRQVFSDLEQHQSCSAKQLREQLSGIQNTIDMLIARYNLPPPPTF